MSDWAGMFDGIERSTADKVETFEFWRVAAQPLTREDFDQMVAELLTRPPAAPCGTAASNPHIVSPTARRFPACVRCGAGWADNALADDMEARGIDCSDVLGIDGKPHPRSAG